MMTKPNVVKYRTHFPRMALTTIDHKPQNNHIKYTNERISTKSEV